MRGTRIQAQPAVPVPHSCTRTHFAAQGDLAGLLNWACSTDRVLLVIVWSTAHPICREGIGTRNELCLVRLLRFPLH